MKMKKNQIVLIRVVSVAVLMAALALILIFGASDCRSLQKYAVFKAYAFIVT